MSKRTTYYCDACEREIHPVELSAKLVFKLDVETVYVEGGKAERRLNQEICCDCYRKILLIIDSKNEHATFYLDRDIRQVKEIIEPKPPAKTEPDISELMKQHVIKVRPKHTRAGNFHGFAVTIDGKQYNIFGVLSKAEAIDSALHKHHKLPLKLSGIERECGETEL